MHNAIGHQPPVTRCYIVASATLMLLCSLDVISPFSLYLNWQLIIYELQLWRLVTCFLFFGTFGLPFFWNTYVLVFYCSSLEDVAFHSKSADFLWMLLCGAGMLLFLTYFCGNTYFIMFTVRAPYLPWVLAGISLMMGGNIQDHLMGIAVGHVYYFFEDVYPLLPTSKGLRIFRTPKVLKLLCNQRD
eukprot:TRINITY_DN19104_c0_g1_i2.p1 TRINITY_DN19104_c0_g1~~TRINITY_DN19104_c0_g1_i2.p1  ORF type:complete len:187 (+),score=34.41 TRINITY_DN19104_c0_g1_i2:96-656(+)